jgi:hypothetical protein
MSGSPNSYEKMVLSHLEKVEQLPPEVQADIAKRVGTYLKLASAAKTDELKSEVRISPRQAHKSGDLVVEDPIRMRYASSAPVVAASITGPSPISCNCSRSK